MTVMKVVNKCLDFALPIFSLYYHSAILLKKQDVLEPCGKLKSPVFGYRVVPALSFTLPRLLLT
jgi:hypothetical protein